MSSKEEKREKRWWFQASQHIFILNCLLFFSLALSLSLSLSPLSFAISNQNMILFALWFPRICIKLQIRVIRRRNNSRYQSENANKIKNKKKNGKKNMNEQAENDLQHSSKLRNTITATNTRVEGTSKTRFIIPTAAAAAAIISILHFANTSFASFTTIETQDTYPMKQTKNPHDSILLSF